MENVPLLFVDHLAELLERWTLHTIADSFKRCAWERTLQLHRTNRQTVDVYIRRRSDGWDVRLIVNETQGLFTWEEARTFDRRFSRFYRCFIDYGDAQLLRYVVLEDEFLVSESQFDHVLECFRSNHVSAHIVVSKTVFDKLEEYEIVLDQLASVPFTAPSICVLNQFSYNFFSKQATNIQVLSITQVERPEDEKLLLKLIAMDNIKSCLAWSSRVLDFAVVEACVEKWKADDTFFFSVGSSGRWSEQKIEQLFGKPDGRPDHYSIQLEGRTSLVELQPLPTTRPLPEPLLQAATRKITKCE
ncbi:hypothetical protein QR680_007663 [Steinernema hermaphroditum]|uniref:Uncharacterized protein n=1 Tax=Steinernema hermaphroditum TaxID=289476 RepID=A0AA39M6S1_9BILA|nr:hypothetical protein QR680_007663 [Steinernema hermaphroditum]